MTDAQQKQIIEAGQSANFSEENIERFLCVVERSAKQWQVIVFPSMLAFVVLAIFGFYLIYSLTGDIRTIARSIDPNMGHHMARMTDSMQKMNVTMRNMSSDIRSLPPMLTHMERMDNSVNNMVNHTRDMNRSMQAITVTNDQMRQSMATMTLQAHQVARPMSKMNSFMPW